MWKQALHKVRSLRRVVGVIHGSAARIVFALLPAHEHWHIKLAIPVGVLTDDLIDLKLVVGQFCVQNIAALVAVDGAIGARS